MSSARGASGEQSVDGILCLNKGPGPTSHDVVAWSRRLLGVQHIGHAGTLDPLAEGVLLLLLGKATRLADYAMDSTKVYCAVVVLGTETTTYDAEGSVIARTDISGVGFADIESALAPLTGAVSQSPPPFSAIKRNGVPLYRLARKGERPLIEPRDVQVHRIEVLDWQPPALHLRVHVGKGTYIRSLAHDLGASLGTGAYLHHLVRVASGAFSVRDALTQADLQTAVECGYWRELVYAMDEALTKLRALIVSDAQEMDLGFGRSWPAGSLGGVGVDNERVRAYSGQGTLLALAERDREGTCWRPRTVLI